MEENYNSDPHMSGDAKTSTSSKSSSKTTGDSEVQQGRDVEKNHKKSYEKSDEQQEYLKDANNNTEVANESPVQGGKGQTQ